MRIIKPSEGCPHCRFFTAKSEIFSTFARRTSHRVRSPRFLFVVFSISFSSLHTYYFHTFLLLDVQAELHRDRIYGAHVAEYMEYLTEEDETKYKEHFASYIENEITFDDVEEMYKETHKAIREDPAPAPKAAFTPDKSFKNTVSHGRSAVLSLWSALEASFGDGRGFVCRDAHSKFCVMLSELPLSCGAGRARKILSCLEGRGSC